MKTFETPINEIESIYAYFQNPAHSLDVMGTVNLSGDVSAKFTPAEPFKFLTP